MTKKLYRNIIFHNILDHDVYYVLALKTSPFNKMLFMVNDIVLSISEEKEYAAVQVYVDKCVFFSFKMKIVSRTFSIVIFHDGCWLPRESRVIFYFVFGRVVLHLECRQRKCHICPNRDVDASAYKSQRLKSKNCPKASGHVAAATRMTTNQTK